MEEKTWKRLFCEFLGAFLVVLVMAGTTAYYASMANEFTLISALSFGAIIAVVIYLFGNISGGHANPAVTLGFALCGRIKWLDTILYWLAQFLGGFLAACLVFWIFGAGNNAGASLGPLTFSNVWKAVAIETIITTILVFTFLYMTKNWKVSLMSGITLGLVVTSSFIFGGNLTGASANPARSLGPALFSGNLGTLWIYFLGPVLGAVIASIIFSIISMSSYTKALDKDGNYLTNDCCENIMVKEVQSYDNCGKPFLDENGNGIKYKKYKIKDSRNTYTINTKEDHREEKVFKTLGVDGKVLKQFDSLRTEPSVKDLVKIGPDHSVNSSLNIEGHVNELISKGNELISDRPLKIKNKIRNQSSTPSATTQIFNYSDFSSESEPIRSIPEKKSEPIKYEPFDSIPEKKSEPIKYEPIQSPLKFSDEDKYSRNEGRVSDKLSNIIKQSYQTKIPFTSPTSLSRAMGGLPDF